MTSSFYLFMLAGLLFSCQQGTTNTDEAIKSAIADYTDIPYGKADEAKVALANLDKVYGPSSKLSADTLSKILTPLPDRLRGAPLASPFKVGSVIESDNVRRRGRAIYSGNDYLKVEASYWKKNDQNNSSLTVLEIYDLGYLPKWRRVLESELLELERRQRTEKLSQKEMTHYLQLGFRTDRYMSGEPLKDKGLTEKGDPYERSFFQVNNISWQINHRHYGYGVPSDYVSATALVGDRFVVVLQAVSATSINEGKKLVEQLKINTEWVEKLHGL